MTVETIDVIEEMQNIADRCRTGMTTESDAQVVEGVRTILLTYFERVCAESREVYYDA